MHQRLDPNLVPDGRRPLLFVELLDRDVLVRRNVLSPPDIPEPARSDQILEPPVVVEHDGRLSRLFRMTHDSTQKVYQTIAILRAREAYFGRPFASRRARIAR